MAEVELEGDDFEGIACPIDCWEIVSSSPSSPTAQDRIQSSSWEPFARESGGDHVGGAEVLPLLSMVDNHLQNERASEKLSVLEHAEDLSVGGMPEMVSDMPFALDKYNVCSSPYMSEDSQEGKLCGDSMNICGDIMEHGVREMLMVVGANPRGFSCQVPKAYHDVSSDLSTSASSSPIKQPASPVHVHRVSFRKGESSSSHSALVPAMRDVAAQAGDIARRSPCVTSPSDGGGRRSSRFTCAAWILTHLRRWQHQLKCAKAMWSVALAAAVMGILFLGRSWHCMLVQNRLLQTQLGAKDKKITQLMFQLMQAKETISKTRQVPVIWTRPSLQVRPDHI